MREVGVEKERVRRNVAESALNLSSLSFISPTRYALSLPGNSSTIGVSPKSSLASRLMPCVEGRRYEEDEGEGEEESEAAAANGRVCCCLLLPLRARGVVRADSAPAAAAARGLPLLEQEQGGGSAEARTIEAIEKCRRPFVFERELA